MRGRFDESELSEMKGLFHRLRLVEAPPHRAESWFSVLWYAPLPARGERCAAVRGEGRCGGAAPAQPPHRCDCLKYLKSGAGWFFLVGIR